MINAHNIEVLFADLDGVETREPDSDKHFHRYKYFQRNNMDVLKNHIIKNVRNFIDEYMDDDNEKKQEYLKIIQEKLNEVKKIKKEFPQDPSEKEREVSSARSKILIDKLGVGPSNIWHERLESTEGNTVMKLTVEDWNAPLPKIPSWYSYEDQEREKEKYYKRFVFKSNTPDSLPIYEKEKWCMEKAAEAGIPTSKCLYAGEESEYAFLVSEFIEGKIGSESEIDQKEIYRKLGEYSKVVNSIPVNSYGEDLDKEQAEYQNNWKEKVKSDINGLFGDNFFIDKNILTEDHVDRIKSRLEEMYEWEFNPTLCHGNLCPENTIVSPDKTIYAIDWGNAEGHRALHFELANLLVKNTKKEYIDAFIDGYSIRQNELSEMQRDINTLAILCLLKNIKSSQKIKKDSNGQEFIKESLKRLDELES